MAGLFLLAMLAQAPDFEALYRQAWEQRERVLGAQAAKTKESAKDLALYLAGRGDYERAREHLEASLETASSAEEATALHNWGVASEENEAPVAERLYRKALQIRVKVLPALDAELAATRLNLAGLLLEKNPAEAAPLIFAALRAFEAKLGAMDARTGAACGMAGVVLATRGDVAGAERMFRRALAVAEQAHGPKSVRTASALENLADLLAQTGRESAARPLLERAEAIRRGAR